MVYNFNNDLPLVETSLSTPNKIVHSTNTLEHTLIFLKGVISEHVFMNLISLNIN